MKATREQIDAEKGHVKSLLSHGAGLSASRRDMSAVSRRACEELVAEGLAEFHRPVPWAKSGSYAATKKLLRRHKANSAGAKGRERER